MTCPWTEALRCLEVELDSGVGSVRIARAAGTRYNAGETVFGSMRRGRFGSNAHTVRHTPAKAKSKSDLVVT